MAHNPASRARALDARRSARRLLAGVPGYRTPAQVGRLLGLSRSSVRSAELAAVLKLVRWARAHPAPVPRPAGALPRPD